MKQALLRTVPAFFVIGAGMELFMIKTGFYDIVTRKEGERTAERKSEEDRMREKMNKLGIKFEKK
jgi:hypothetical protein